MPAAFKRTERLNDLFRTTISSLLVTKINNPRVQGLSVTNVDIAADLSVAKIYFCSLNTALDHEPMLVEDVIEGLNHVSGFIRHHLSKELYLKKIPQLRFIYDKSLTQQNRIENLFREIAQEPSHES